MSDPARMLNELAARFGLPAPAIGQLRALLDLLERDPDPPTTVTAWAKALDVHVADSLVALEVPQVCRARALADLGSGAGFPGMALAVALPDARVSLVESSRRTCSFLGRALAESGLRNATVVHTRVEEWAEGRESCDVVTARALAALPVVAEYAAPLLRPGGTLVAWRGRPDPREERDAAAAAEVLGLEPQGVVAVRPYRQSRNRHLHVFRKSGQTPERFPRRAGMARKRPLRAHSEDLA